MRKLHWLPLILAAGVSGLAGARDPALKLPDIGSSAASIMSPTDQRAYGASMLHELRSYGLVLDDPLLDDYLNTLGYRLVAHSDRPDMSFTFFIVRDSEINAFAVPGGYIAANAGLIVGMHREDELAAVVAHEISHITQEHTLRAFEDARKNSIPIALAMLGAVIATSGRNDDSAAAAIVSGTSLMQQQQINFTRHDEAEADHVGIQTLARAGFDPLAMADAFSTLQRVMRSNGVDVPEFLRTHPVDIRRIADAKARAVQLVDEAKRARRDNQRSDALPFPDSPLLPLARIANATATTANSTTASAADDAGGEAYFELMRERARVLSAGSTSAVLSYYADNRRDGSAFDTPANRYGYALALTRAHQPGQAVDELRKLVAEQPKSSALRLALADAEDQNGNGQVAHGIYDRLNSDFPGNHTIVLAYAKSLLAHGTEKDARHAVDLLRPLIGRYDDDPELQQTFGRANQLAGDKVRAAEAYAQATYLNGHAEDALNQLKALAKQSDLDYYQRARVDAHITAMTPLVLELRRRDKRAAPDSLAPVLACCRHR
ncbi:MAG TPA: M48 family metalloprotease [Rhodanobacteraceae bacterium]|nr:M48 family metalloprotease [Rhodanobacteraceae bacterium]